MLSLSYLTPPQRISHRWLAAYDCTNKILPMVGALYVLYYSWVPKVDRHLYKDELNVLYTKHSVTEISRKRLAEIQKVLQEKSLTEKGKERKLRLVEKLIEQSENFLLIAHHYVSVLPLLKSLVLILFLFNWDSLHARLNSYYKVWSYKKKKHKKDKTYKKSV